MESVIETDHFLMTQSDFKCKKGWKCEGCPVIEKCDAAMMMSEQWSQAIAAGVETDL